jgi:hypothetical protein
MRYAFLEGLRDVEYRIKKHEHDGHVIVVFTRPTFAKRDILAKSVAKSGVSCIFSRSAFEHRGESISACTYKSRNVTAPRLSSLDDEDDDGEDNGSVKTRSWAAKM